MLEVRFRPPNFADPAPLSQFRSARNDPPTGLDPPDVPVLLRDTPAVRLLCRLKVSTGLVADAGTEAAIFPPSTSPPPGGFGVFVLSNCAVPARSRDRCGGGCCCAEASPVVAPDLLSVAADSVTTSCNSISPIAAMGWTRAVGPPLACGCAADRTKPSVAPRPPPLMALLETAKTTANEESSQNTPG